MEAVRWKVVADAFATRRPKGAVVATSPPATARKSIRYEPIPAARSTTQTIVSPAAITRRAPC